MCKPLWWIWLCVFVDTLRDGNSYYAIRRGDVQQAWFVAGVVRRTCRAIRRG